MLQLRNIIITVRTGAVYRGQLSDMKNELIIHPKGTEQSSATGGRGRETVALAERNLNSSNSTFSLCTCRLQTEPASLQFVHRGANCIIISVYPMHVEQICRDSLIIYEQRTNSKLQPPMRQTRDTEPLAIQGFNIDNAWVHHRIHVIRSPSRNCRGNGVVRPADEDFDRILTSLSMALPRDTHRRSRHQTWPYLPDPRV
jgi:hypothetical protein